MKNTLQLLEKAQQKTAPLSERQLSIQLGHSPYAIRACRTRGNLSPVIAGQLAELVGEDVREWIALAALESEPRSRVTDHLRRALTSVRNL